MLHEVVMKKKIKSSFQAKKNSHACNKRARLIVRNLPFNVTEEALKTHFTQFGDISDINLLKRPDGKLIGCGFIQYAQKQNAAKAIHYTSGKSFLGRIIIVDWAIPKNKFVQSNKIENEKIKQEPFDESTSEFINIAPKEEVLDDVSDDESNNESDSSRSTDKSTDPGPESSNQASNISVERPKPKASHDISEGKTVFLRNVSFNITNDELKTFMETIGPVYYAVICIDPLTEHSKGTAFVKFKNKAHADKCLESGVDLNLKGSSMIALPALERKKISNLTREKHPDKKKDSRNLYLVKEGAVIAGTKAAIGVSMSDMKKRLELELWKSNMLRNLNMFISRTRLIIHNLPASYEDRKLRELFKKFAPPRSKITEAKVMKNLYQLDMEGKPTSKGYGFVSFNEHNDALTALRKINNNPSIFHPNKRPIVAFSIENRSVIKVKQSRAERSKLNNPLCPASKKPRPAEPSQKVKKVKRRMRSEDVPSFAGIESHQGQTSLPSKRKILSQQEVHFQNVKEVRRDRKRKRLEVQVRKEKKKEPKVKSRKLSNKLEEKQFTQLVNKYRQQILPKMSLKKWYESN